MVDFWESPPRQYGCSSIAKKVGMVGMEWLKLLNLSERSFASMEILFLKTEIADICKFSSSEGRHSRQLKSGLASPTIHLVNEVEFYLA